MQKTKVLPFLAALFLFTACILNPVESPPNTPDSTETPNGPGESPVAETKTPSATESPAFPAGFFPIAIGTPWNPESATLLGGSENGIWVDAATAAARLSGGEVYNLYSPTGLSGTAVGSKLTQDMICKDFSMQWDPPPSATSLVGLAGGWNALPRLPEDPIISSFPTYTTAAGDWLASQGMPVPDPLKLTGLKRVDLDGDGTMEAIISASRFSEDTLHDAGAGDFSMVLLLREAVPETIQLAGNYYPTTQSLAFPTAYSLLSILDLNGDGRMEVIVDVSRWEGGGVLVFTFDGSSVNQVFNSVCSL